MENGVFYDITTGVSLMDGGISPIVASVNGVAISLTGSNNVVNINNTTSNNSLLTYGNNGTTYWSDGNSWNGGLNDYIVYDNRNSVVRLRVSNTGLSITGTASITNGITSNFNNVLNTTPEYRLTTNDGYYSRLQRFTSSNTTYLKGQVYQPSGVGLGINLPGNSYFTSADTGLPSSTKPTFSVSLWYFANNNAASNYGIIGWGLNNSTWFSIHQNSLNIQVYQAGGSGVIIGSSGGINYNQWNHIVYTCDGTYNRLYINNVAITPTTTTYSITLGGNFRNAMSFNSQGLTIDQLLIYGGIALSVPQINLLYNGGGGRWDVPATASLLRRYDFEGNGVDSVGGNNVSLVINSGTPNYTTGYIPTIGSGTITEGTPITYSDGINGSERGTLYLGDQQSGTWLQGLSIKTLINNSTIPFIIGSNGYVLINPTNISQTSLASAPLHIINASAQTRFGYDVNNYMEISVGSGGTTAFNISAQSGTPTFTFNKIINGLFQTDATSGNANFASIASYNSSAVGGANTALSIGTVSATNVKTWFYGSGGSGLGAGNNFANVLISTATLTKSGINPILCSLAVKPIATISGTGTASITSTVYIDGGATGGVANYGLYVNNSNSYFGGNITAPTVRTANYADDTAAAAGGIPVGGLYNTSGVLKIRLT